MSLENAVNQYVQIKLINFPEELVGFVTGIYHPEDWLLAKLVSVESIGLWFENPNYIRSLVIDEEGNDISPSQQHEEILTTNILIRWDFIASILVFPSEEVNEESNSVRRIGFQLQM